MEPLFQGIYGMFYEWMIPYMEPFATIILKNNPNPQKPNKIN